jgi:predicted transcriptional regulator
MKTIQKNITVNKLEIFTDETADSPRKTQETLGFFLVKDEKHFSPDEHPELKEIMISCGDAAEDIEDHIALMKKAIKEQKLTISDIFPITKHEHGNISYSLGTTKGFDYSNNGFYFIEKDRAKLLSATTKKKKKEIIESELKEYNQWVNNEIYAFILYKNNGEEKASMSGFYEIEDIRAYLPKSWKKEDLNKYIK